MKTIKEMSESTGVSIRALRYYDEIGLLIPSTRSEAGYRLYDEDDLKKLQVIQALKEMDLSLDEIRDVLDSGEDYKPELQKARGRLEKKILQLKSALRTIDIMLGDDKVIVEFAKQNIQQGDHMDYILDTYGSKEKYLEAVEYIAGHPEEMKGLQEELKEIYYSFAKVKAGSEEARDLVRRLETNMYSMSRASNTKHMLVSMAELYLSNEKTAKVIDSLYGDEVAETVGRAIQEYYDI